MIQVSVAPAASRSPHSSSPTVSDTAKAPALQVDVMCGPSSPEVSYSVMEELGTSPIEPSLRRIARTLADPATAIHGLPSAVLVPAARRNELGRQGDRGPGAESENSTDTLPHPSDELRTCNTSAGEVTGYG